jgi:hypothetical protein
MASRDAGLSVISHLRGVARARRFVLMPPLLDSLLRLEHGSAYAIIFVCGCTSPANFSDPLVGEWHLNLADSRYEASVDRRTEEVFTCASLGDGVTCTIHSVRDDGRVIDGGFSAAYDGVASPVAGIPDVDEVSLRRTSDRAAVATFSFRGRPAFAYRANQSMDGKRLTFGAIDPVTGSALKSRVVYERR